jgi:DNA polymerase-3 subunit alpha
MAQNWHTEYADRKNGRRPVAYFHPDAAEALEDTYGLCIFQEQLMRLAQKFAGYSLEEADNLRKACAK